MNTLVCLVSRQPMANVLPVLMFKPDLVYLLSTKEELKCGKHLQNLFNKNNIKTILYDNIDAYDNKILIERLDKIFSNSNFSITLNSTGGTKIMAISAYEYFRNKNYPVIYCNTEDKKIIHLLPERRTEELKAELKIEEYLASYGYKIKEEKPMLLDFDYEELFTLIEKNNLMNEFVDFTTSVRKALSEETYKTINSNNKNFSFQKTPSNFLLLLKIDNQNLKYKFLTKDFLFGNWLEYYVFWKYKYLNPDEIKIGVKIVSENDIRNEVDIILLKNYKLYLISCKSGKAENNTLYELETLRSFISGTYGKGIVVFSNNPNENIIKRANELYFTSITDFNKITL